MEIEKTTHFWYGGSDRSIVALFVERDGVRLTVTRFESGEDFEVFMQWNEFMALAADIPKITQAR
ncbi:hypothetical protein DMH04_30265 [Kibdelosporangium aridum]|uniref:DUF397 domain-containing protein n=1 Tax=Kibdelosporangium aridum TaxID=2030 RepID=A0A428Z3C4_KIBAR|nr:hypothetical protein [Kibdelosporangium aridum]RSM80418.1 hypothetical protein DMH04_30265 [Kibdelosporangium aridum]